MHTNLQRDGLEGNKTPEPGQRKKPCLRRPKEGTIPGRQESTVTSAGRRGTLHGVSQERRRTNAREHRTRCVDRGRTHQQRGEYFHATQGEGSGERELGASGQPEHCRSDRQPSISLKYQEGKKASNCPLQCRINLQQS